jgi:hypothetical protein
VECESAVGFSAGVMMSTKVFVAGPHNVSTALYEETFDVQRIVSRGIHSHAVAASGSRTTISFTPRYPL